MSFKLLYSTFQYCNIMHPEFFLAEIIFIFIKIFNMWGFWKKINLCFVYGNYLTKALSWKEFEQIQFFVFCHVFAKSRLGFSSFIKQNPLHNLTIPHYSTWCIWLCWLKCEMWNFITRTIMCKRGSVITGNDLLYIVDNHFVSIYDML